jgi:hypothetical protein
LDRLIREHAPYANPRIEHSFALLDNLGARPWRNLLANYRTDLPSARDF